MELLICNDCGVMDMTLNGDKCDKCRKIEQLELEKQQLVAKIDALQDTSKQWLMNFMGDSTNTKNYHYHLGQIAAFTDIKNILSITNK